MAIFGKGTRFPKFASKPSKMKDILFSTHRQMLLFGALVLLSSGTSFAQVYSDLSKNPQERTEYPYMLPIWGQKVQDKGFELPFSAGLSVNYLWQDSDIKISNVNVGFNGGTLYDVDDLIRFNSTTATSSGINIRPDIWVFPFLNVYGIFARAQSRTNVDVSIYIPRISGTEELFSIQTSPEFRSETVGFGLTPTAGFFGGWIAFDMNFTWTDIDAQENPVFGFVFDPRIGKTFELGRPHRNISLWVGGFRVKVSRDTQGTLAFNEVLPTEEWALKIDQGQQKVGEAQVELDSWWDALTPIEKANPVNKVKYETNQAKLNLAGRVLGAADNALGVADSSELNYTLDKRQATMWTMTVGSQFQLNKNWMIRAEYGFSSGRQQFFTGLQYRFGL